MEARVKVRPSGLVNGAPWPQVGETIDLPDSVVVEMANAGWLEVVAARPKQEKATPKVEPERRARGRRSAG